MDTFILKPDSMQYLKDTNFNLGPMVKHISPLSLNELILTFTDKVVITDIIDWGSNNMGNSGFLSKKNLIIDNTILFGCYILRLDYDADIGKLEIALSPDLVFKTTIKIPDFDNFSEMWNFFKVIQFNNTYCIDLTSTLKPIFKKHLESGVVPDEDKLELLAIFGD